MAAWVEAKVEAGVEARDEAGGEERGAEGGGTREGMEVCYDSGRESEQNVKRNGAPAGRRERREGGAEGGLYLERSIRKQYVGEMNITTQISDKSRNPFQ